MTIKNEGSSGPQPGLSLIQQYPCDMGIPGNALGRGYHHFEAGPTGVICCRFCGARPAVREEPVLPVVRPSWAQPMPPAVPGTRIGSGRTLPSTSQFEVHQTSDTKAEQ